MIQVLTVQRSFHEDGRLKPITPRRCGVVAAAVVDLEDTDHQLLRVIAERSTPDKPRLIPIEDFEMLMTKMHNDEAPDKAEVRAVFMLADVENPRNLLNINELESGMRYWRILIPLRQRIKDRFDETYFGMTKEEHETSLKGLLRRLDSSVVEDRDIDDIMDMIKGHTKGGVDRESTLSAVIMQVLVQKLNRQHDAAVRDELNQSSFQDTNNMVASPVSNKQKEEIQHHSAGAVDDKAESTALETPVAIKASQPCCNIS